MESSSRFPLLPAALLALVASCGSGTILLSSSGSSGGSNADPSVGSNLLLFSTKTSPAVLRFDLLDAESNKTDVRIEVRAAGAANSTFRPATLASGAFTLLDGSTGQTDEDLDNLSTSNAGRTHYKLWDFAADGFGAAGQEGVVVRIEPNKGSNDSQTSDTDPSTVGNDPPTGTLTAENGTLSGISLLSIVAVDTDPDEEVLVEIQFREDRDDYDNPGDCWLTAKRAGADGDDFVDTSADGEIEDFFWDTNFDLIEDGGECIDLNGRAADVQVRMIITELPESPDDQGEVVITEPILVRVDNNSDPIAIFENDLFVINPDGRRGIPIPFTVLDEEGHDVDVAIQWRRENEGFPDLLGVELPATVEELRELLTDPTQADLRRQLQIAGELPLWFEGRTGILPGGLDTDVQLRLPELGSSALQVADVGLEGLTLEILRSSRSPRPVTLPASVTLQNPVGIEASARSGGTRILALDDDGMGWRLREIDLDPADPQAPPTVLATGNGAPRALTVTADERFAFVATDTPAVAWIDLTAGTTLASVGMAGPARDLVAASETHAFAIACPTTGACGQPELVRIDFAGATPEVISLGIAFDDAHGLALDPLMPDRAYVAETGADRVLVVDVETLEVSVLAAEPASGAGAAFPTPRFLAVEDSGRLLCTTVSGAEVILTGLELRAPQDGGDDLVADPIAYPLVALGGLADAEARVSAGPFGQRLAALPGSNTISLGGGVHLRRTISTYEAARTVVTVEGADLPVLATGTPWRIARRLGRPESSPSGAKNVFLWDSSEVAGGGRVRLRIVALDTDIGDASAGLSSKVVRAPLNNSSPLLAAVSAGDFETRAIATGDMDGDGDLDVVSADFDTSTTSGWNIHYQEWTFDAEALYGRTTFRSEVASAPLLDRPRGIDVGDLDGDGRMDVAVTDTAGNELIPFLQTAPGVFTPQPITLAGGPWKVVIADMDADGIPDLVTGCRNEVRVRFGDGTGQFPVEVQLEQDDRRPRGLAVADMNGDGLLDVVSANQLTATYSVFLGLGSRTFAPLFEGESVPGSPDAFSDGLAVADLDRDGDLDILVTNVTTNNVSIIEQTTTDPMVLEFEPPILLGDTNSTSEVADIEVADFDRDGMLDLITVNENGVQRSLTIFYQRPSPTSTLNFELDANGAFNAVADSFQPLDVAVEDLDGDGGVDILFGDEGQEVVIYLNEALGRFTPDVNGPLSDPLNETNPAAVVAGDTDRDGNTDLVVANNEADSISIFRQDAPGIFNASATSYSDPQGTRAVAPGAVDYVDLDGDGFGDILFAARGDDGDTSNGNLGFFYGDGSGSYGPIQLPGAPDDVVRPSGFRPEDLDGDGDLDLIYVSSPRSFAPDAPLPSSIGYFEQTAPRTFGPPVTLFEDIDLAIGLRIADVDSDGFLDMMYMNRCLREAVFMRGAPGPIGTFEPPITFAQDTMVYGSTGGGAPDTGPWVPAGLELADLDGDGDLDVIAASSFYRVVSNTCTLTEDEDRSAIVVFYQDMEAHPATGGFGLEPDFVLDGPAFPEGPRIPSAVDFDLDGDLDLVAAGQFQVTTWLQLSPRSFVRNQILIPTVDAGSYGSLLTDDLDGDGDADLALASFRLDFVRVLFGNH